MADPSSPTGVDSPRPVQVVVADEQSDVVDRRRSMGGTRHCGAPGRGRPGELTLTFVDRDEITVLNGEHMGEDGPTDVLSFPLDDELGRCRRGAGPARRRRDLPVASLPRPVTPARIDDELALLTVHGVLHVLGHDHAEPDERALMQAAELRHLVAHHWKGPAPAEFRWEHLDP